MYFGMEDGITTVECFTHDVSDSRKIMENIIFDIAECDLGWDGEN